MNRLALAACLLAAACAAEQPRQSSSANDARVTALEKQLAEKEHQLELQSEYAEDATRTIVALQEHMAQAAALEDSMGLPDPSGENQRQPISASRRDQLLAGVQRLQLVLQEQAKLVADFRQRETQYSVKIGDMEKAIANYEQQIADSQRELAEMRSGIEQMRVEVQELRRDNAKKQKEIADQQRVIAEQGARVDDLQRASRIGYYTARPLQELLQAKIVTQRRVMMRRVRALSPDVKRDDFEEVNIDERREFLVPAPMQRVELVTGHPRASYELANDGARQSKLTVINPDEFWKLRYLVIAIK